MSAIDLNGAIVGGQLGYNWQSGQFLLGIEGDASTLADGGDHVTGPGLPGAATLGADMNYLASIRGRLGWAINNWLLYGTVGLGLLAVRIHRERAGAAIFTAKLRLDDEGIVYGGGVEWMLAYGVSLRAEYLRYDLGHSTLDPDQLPRRRRRRPHRLRQHRRGARGPQHQAQQLASPGRTAERHSAMPFAVRTALRRGFRGNSHRSCREFSRRPQGFGNGRGIVEWVPPTKEWNPCTSCSP